MVTSSRDDSTNNSFQKAKQSPLEFERKQHIPILESPDSNQMSHEININDAVYSVHRLQVDRDKFRTLSNF